jgi:hypothetical protein
MVPPLVKRPEDKTMTKQSLFHPKTKLPRLFFEYLCVCFTRVLIILFGAGAYGEPSAALIAKTQEVFGRREKREISPEEARQIIRSFTNFVRLIKEVRRGQK